jgi:hypothetical protein
MAVTTEVSRARAFDPDMMSGVRPPPTPSWDIGPEKIDDGKTLATGLAWFGIGLGLVEVLATEQLCDYLGMEEQEDLVRLMGFREIATGVGILSQRKPTPWIMGRVAGDILDLALLAPAVGPGNRKRHRALGAMGAVAGVMALDVLCYRQLTTTGS